ncbi:MAG TPA: shikimate kinase, partial [Acidimicrobiia bacterium]|nr:shikimate kinase [Acidimicrobiia bacterium]
MKHLVLIGLMGAGKTTVGRRCAEKLGRDFVDTDDIVIKLAGMSIDEIFQTQGEPKFREFERQV